MFARRTATEVPSGHQHAATRVARIVQDESWDRLPVRVAAPVVKQKIAKAGAFDALEELLGNDLVGIDVRAIQRYDNPVMYTKRLHPLLLELPVANVGKVSRNGRRSGHHGAHEV